MQEGAAPRPVPLLRHFRDLALEASAGVRGALDFRIDAMGIFSASKRHAATEHDYRIGREGQVYEIALELKWCVIRIIVLDCARSAEPLRPRPSPTVANRTAAAGRCGR